MVEAKDIIESFRVSRGIPQAQWTFVVWRSMVEETDYYHEMKDMGFSGSVLDHFEPDAQNEICLAFKSISKHRDMVDSGLKKASEKEIDEVLADQLNQFSDREGVIYASRAKLSTMNRTQIMQLLDEFIKFRHEHPSDGDLWGQMAIF